MQTQPGQPGTTTLSVVVLSFNRRDALERTLRELTSQGVLAAGVDSETQRCSSEVIVVDNTSTDGTLEMLAADFPGVRVVALPRNVGVTGFNLGVREARGRYVLILDDDSWPQPGVVEKALAFLDANQRTAAVALHPRHPGSHRSEWRFARRARSFWPVMGCGNIVRREAWAAVGGYEELFFLYRNDTDLALKLLASGQDVYFDPDWTVWHDSPAATEKSERWLRYATRNWLWMCRRHGRGMSRLVAQGMGVLWAARQAGFNRQRLGEVLKGVRAGVHGEAPQMPATVVPDGIALRELLRLQVRSRLRFG